MKLLVFLAQPKQNLYSLVNSGLGNVYLLKTTNNASLMCQTTIILIVGGGTYEAYGTRLQIGFQHIRGIRTAVAATAGTNHIVNLIDVDNGIALSNRSFHHHLDALLEVTTKLRAGKHRPHVHLVDATALQTFRHLTTLNALSQSIHQGRLAYTRFAHMQRVVFLLPTEHLNSALQFLITADEGIMVGKCVVDTGDKASPGLLFDLGVYRIIAEVFTIWQRAVAIERIFIRPCTEEVVADVVMLIELDERGEKLCDILAQMFLQHVGCPRLFEVQHCIGEMGHINLFTTGIESVVACIMDELAELHRCCWLLIAVGR